VTELETNNVKTMKTGGETTTMEVVIIITTIIGELFKAKATS